MLRLTRLLLLCFPLLVSAQIYKHVDEDGNVTFTDTPPPNSEKVDLPVSNTAVPPPVISAPPPPEPAPARRPTWSHHPSKSPVRR